MPQTPTVSRFTVAASAARTVTTTFGPFYNDGGYKGVRLFFDVTAVTATPTVVPTIEVRDSIGTDRLALLTLAALTAVITAPIVADIYPGEVAVANLVANRHIGQGFYVVMTAGDADSCTYSISGEWLP